MTTKLDRARRTLLSATLFAGFGAGSSACTSQPRLALDTPQPLAEFTPVNAGRQIAVDANHLYWMSWEVAPPPGWQGPESALLVVTMADKDGNNPVTIANTGYQSDTFDNYTLRIDGANTYFSDEQFIKSAPSTGGGAQTTLAMDAGLITGITLDDTSVYWTTSSYVDPSNGSVMRVSKTGGTPVVVVPSQANPAEIAVDATSIYWVADQGLMKVDKAGGVPSALSTTLEYSHLLVDDSDVYFDANNLVRKVAKSGGPSTVVMNDAVATADLLAGDAGSLYVVKDGNTIMKVSKADYSVTSLYQEADGDLNGILAIAVDDTKIYWTSTDGDIRSIGK
jgi:hypothetical protein